MASVVWDPAAEDNIPYVKAEQTYYGSHGSTSAPLKLRIATGGAGQSGLIKALANAFIDDQIKRTGCEPFAVSWLKADTADSFNYLAQGSADLSITYHKVAEEIAMEQGVSDRRVYCWRDHFMLVGPKLNPAKLSTDGKTSILTLFTQLFRAAVASNDVKFLSRFDKSATNVKEASLWTRIGQVPWAYPYSFFYHVVPMFPFQALEVAAKLGEYHLVDWGTWNGVDDWVRESMRVYYLAEDDDADMLNPARALVGAHGENKKMAVAFADWMVRDDGGQEVVSKFAVKGVVLYTKAPSEEKEEKLGV